MDIACASRPKKGEPISGDHCIILPNHSHTLCAVIDGLGHGPFAAEAALRAAELIRQHQNDPLESIMHTLNQGLRPTRGAAITILKLSTDTLQHVAVGNVEISSTSPLIRPFTIPGVVGSKMRKVTEHSFQLTQGNLIVAHTDGISRRFDLAKYRHPSAQRIADAILSDWGKTTDDATCLAIVL